MKSRFRHIVFYIKDRIWIKIQNCHNCVNIFSSQIRNLNDSSVSNNKDSLITIPTIYIKLEGSVT
jgi:hypothetical protein